MKFGRLIELNLASWLIGELQVSVKTILCIPFSIPWTKEILFYAYYPCLFYSLRITFLVFEYSIPWTKHIIMELVDLEDDVQVHNKGKILIESSMENIMSTSLSLKDHSNQGKSWTYQAIKG